MSESENGTRLNPDIDPTLERTPTVLLLDTSGSMSSKTKTPNGNKRPKIDQLNDGLQIFHDEVRGKEHASERVDVALITFGGDTDIEQDFVPINQWSPSSLTSGGSTPMGDAIERAIQVVENKKSDYHNDTLLYNRPLIWLLTDGKPTDMRSKERWEDIQQQLADGSDNQHFEFFAMGVSGADMEKLNELVADPTGRPAIELQEGMFEEYFRFLSNSLETASNPDSGDKYQLYVNHLQ